MNIQIDRSEEHTSELQSPNDNQKKYDRKKKKIEKVDKLIVLLTKKLEDENNNITQK